MGFLRTMFPRLIAISNCPVCLLICPNYCKELFLERVHSEPVRSNEILANVAEKTTTEIYKITHESDPPGQCLNCRLDYDGGLLPRGFDSIATIFAPDLFKS
jgi:hypothetical protein